MNRRITLAAFLIVVFCAGLPRIRAGGPPPPAFDEEGHGAFGPGFFAPDPGPGGLPAVLTYPLPFAGLPGDVLLTEADASVSDVIRFNGNGTLLFYSDNSDGFDNLADTASGPTQFYTNLVRIPEVGLEGNNGATYAPTPNQPGWDPSNPTYFFQSDTTVPEPSSILLVCFGTGAAGIFGWRRKNRRTE